MELSIGDEGQRRGVGLLVLQSLYSIHRVLQLFLLGCGIVPRVQHANLYGFAIQWVTISSKLACQVILGVLAELQLVLDDARVHLWKL